MKLQTMADGVDNPDDLLEEARRRRPQPSENIGQAQFDDRVATLVSHLTAAADETTDLVTHNVLMRYTKTELLPHAVRNALWKAFRLLSQRGFGAEPGTVRMTQNAEITELMRSCYDGEEPLARAILEIEEPE